MKKFKKLVLPLSLIGMLALGSTSVFASNLKSDYKYVPAQPREGFVLDCSMENVAKFNGNKLPRIATLTSSGVSRYLNHNNGQYYAKGATMVHETTTGRQIEHTTTVTLEKDRIFGTTVLVSASESGIGEVWAETGTTPTKGEAKVYWKTN